MCPGLFPDQVNTGIKHGESLDWQRPAGKAAGSGKYKPATSTELNGMGLMSLHSFWFMNVIMPEYTTMASSLTLTGDRNTHKRHILSALCQTGCKSAYITVGGCTAVTKAPYDRLQGPCCPLTGLHLTVRHTWADTGLHFINTASAFCSWNAFLYYVIAFQANNKWQCVWLTGIFY